MLVIVGAPLWFEVKYVKRKIFFSENLVFAFLWYKVVDEAHFDVLNWVRKAAVFAVLAARDFVRVHVAEFGFVLFRVVEPLHPVVGAAASRRTSVGLRVFAKLWRVETVVSSSVFDTVVEEAWFVVMRYWKLSALEPLEVLQHEVRDLDEWSIDVVHFHLVPEEGPICECLVERWNVNLGRTHFLRYLPLRQAIEITVILFAVTGLNLNEVAIVAWFEYCGVFWVLLMAIARCVGVKLRVVLCREKVRLGNVERQRVLLCNWF
jgi:hypothetical protein